MKNFVAVLLCFIVLFLGAMVTCPSADKHKEALHASLNTFMQESINERVEKENTSRLIGMLASVLTSPIVTIVVNNQLKVEDYGVVSVGIIKGNVVTVGVFNHVFTPTSEQIKEAINEAIEEGAKQDSR